MFDIIKIVSYIYLLCYYNYSRSNIKRIDCHACLVKEYHSGCPTRTEELPEPALLLIQPIVVVTGIHPLDISFVIQYYFIALFLTEIY